MSQISFTAFTNVIFQGIIGSLLLYGFFIQSTRKKSRMEILQEKIDLLKRKNKHLVGQNKRLQDVNTFQQSALQREQLSNKKSQSARDKINGELVRRENQIRSLEFEILRERNKVKGGR